MDLLDISLADLKEKVAAARGRQLAALLAGLETDPRRGAGQLLQRARLARAARAREQSRIRFISRHERRLFNQGYRRIAGVDEAGRGALAGPLVAAAVMLRPGQKIDGIDDSKRLSPDRRQSLYEVITAKAHCWAVFAVDAKVIDAVGVHQANLQALAAAASALAVKPDFVISDGFKLTFTDIPTLALVKGDANSVSAAAASIVAKVTRDRILDELDKEFPRFGFCVNKGYGTADHLDVLRKDGPTAAHRCSFFPVEQLIAGQLKLIDRP